MVSNEEIKQMLRNKREGISNNGHLVCNRCGGYYELQPGESWKDFNTECECGGQLIQNDTNTLYSPDMNLSEEEYENKRYQIEIIIAYITFFLFWPISFILAIYLLTRNNNRAKFHAKILLLISIIPIFIIAFSSLLIYRAYFNQPLVNPDSDLSSVRNTRLILICLFNLL